VSKLDLPHFKKFGLTQALASEGNSYVFNNSQRKRPETSKSRRSITAICAGRV